MATQEPRRGRVGKLLKTAFLEGRSPYDAWLSAASSQVAQVLLTFPMSYAQTGMASGIVFQLWYGALGCWSCYMTVCLYLNYRAKEVRENNYQENHDIQWYEVVGGLLGPKWKYITLFFSVALLMSQGAIGILGASSLAHFLNSDLDKRQWNLVFGAVFVLTVFIPKAQHYRVWSFAGIVMTTYTAWFITAATVVHGQLANVKHTGPQTYLGYFTGATNFLYASGGHGWTVELIHSMNRPEKYKSVFLYSTMYIWTLTIPSAVAVYWAFGDLMLDNSYSLVMLPMSKFRVAATVLMILHQFIQIGMSLLPLYLMWEKLIGVHGSDRYLLKSISRIPVVLLVWFMGLMVPFIGLVDSLVGAFFTGCAIYILPCLFHMLVHISRRSRKSSIEQPPFWVPGWSGMFATNLLVVLWVAIVGVGFGAWSGSTKLIHSVHHFGLFAKCYQCTKKA